MLFIYEVPTYKGPNSNMTPHDGPWTWEVRSSHLCGCRALDTSIYKTPSEIHPRSDSAFLSSCGDETKIETPPFFALTFKQAAPLPPTLRSAGSFPPATTCKPCNCIPACSLRHVAAATTARPRHGSGLHCILACRRLHALLLLDLQPDSTRLRAAPCATAAEIRARTAP